MMDFDVCSIKPLHFYIRISRTFCQINEMRGINLIWANLFQQPSLYDNCVSVVTMTEPPGIFHRGVPGLHRLSQLV